MVPETQYSVAHPFRDVETPSRLESAHRKVGDGGAAG